MKMYLVYALSLAMNSCATKPVRSMREDAGAISLGEKRAVIRRILAFAADSGCAASCFCIEENGKAIEQIIIPSYRGFHQISFRLEQGAQGRIINNAWTLTMNFEKGNLFLNLEGTHSLFHIKMASDASGRYRQIGKGDQYFFD